jgi:hypothetical protein
MSTGERYALIATLAVAALISGPWFYTQLLVWKAEGHDHMLTVANIIVTALLWGTLILASNKYWRDSKRSESLEARNANDKADFDAKLTQQTSRAEAAASREQKAEDRVLVADAERRKWMSQARDNGNERDGFKFVVGNHVARIKELETELESANKQEELRPSMWAAINKEYLTSEVFLKTLSDTERKLFTSAESDFQRLLLPEQVALRRIHAATSYPLEEFKQLWAAEGFPEG